MIVIFVFVYCPFDERDSNTAITDTYILQTTYDFYTCYPHSFCVSFFHVFHWLTLTWVFASPHSLTNHHPFPSIFITIQASHCILHNFLAAQFSRDKKIISETSSLSSKWLIWFFFIETELDRRKIVTILCTFFSSKLKILIN